MLGRLRTASLLAALVAAALASASSGQRAGPPGGSPPGLEVAIAAQERNLERLLDTPGIVGAGVGLNPAGKPVIRIYTETPGVAGVPSDLEGVPVQRVTTGVIRARAPTDRFPRPVPIGVSSGHLDTATGTLGVRVTDGTSVYALSNNHVFAAINTASIGDGIIQPGNVDGGSDPADRIGTLHAFQTIDFATGTTNTIDAAIALTIPANVGTATPEDGYGTPSSATTAASVGLAVQKYGRTTGLQNGTVAEINVAIDVCYIFFVVCFEDARFVNQIAVTPDGFSAGGDSGSLIVTQAGNQPVALLFAGGEGRTIGNPIDLVLQRFGVTIDGSSGQDGPPGAPTALTALAGDGAATLGWTPPSFDGGSEVTGYRVYRGTSPGGETLLESVGTITTFEDTGLTNGTTYYYKVSAENAHGEGLLSNEASATPSALVQPGEPLPTLDNFNRPNENPLSDAGRWTNAVNGGVENGLHVSSNQLACTATSTCTAWRSNAQYGPDVEVWTRISTLPGTNNHVRLYARLKEQGSAAYDAYMLRTNQLSGTDEVYLERIDNGAHVRKLTVSQELAAGDLVLLRVEGSTLEGWRHDGVAWSRLGTVTDSTYPGPGFVGIGLRGTTGRLDDFGARTTSANPPGAPTALTALAGDGAATLGWTPPSFDGGSEVTGYRIYRGTSPGGETFLESVGTVTTFEDTGLTNGTTYYYRVSAENENGEGPLSNGASATPVRLVPPAAPLPVLDSFDRPNENPLSDAGRWSNGLAGSGESGLHVSSNQLACSRSTTCTAWRNTGSLGPDAESWARITTLPGNANSLRLYVRVQQPGSLAYDGYMLRTIQQTATDQVVLERVDNGAVVTRLTIAQELAVGDTLLLRAVGPTLEAWRHDGTAWSRLGTVPDSTYAGPGFVGIGLRGTTGRLDDFGARTMGGLPPAAPEITTTSLPGATNTQPYVATLAATGGTPPYTLWAIVSGSLPTGLTLESATGALSGTPSAAPGTYPFTVEVTDTALQTDTQALSIAVADPLAITTTGLPAGTAGQAYAATMSATGGTTPYAWSLVGGSLPPGLSLSSSTGEITGTPSSAGTYSFTARADDSGDPGRSDAQALSIVVAPATVLTITTAGLPEGRVGAAYSAGLSASGGLPPYTWAVASGSLPPGVSLVAASGALTGTPTKQGRYAFTIRVTDSGGTPATRAFSIRVRR
jgi:hypothetical protein